MKQYVGIFSPEFDIDGYMVPIFVMLHRTSKFESIYYYIEKVDSLTEAMELVALYEQAMPVELRTDLQIKIFKQKPDLCYGQKTKSPDEIFKLELDKYQKFMQPKNDSIGKIKLYWHKLKNGDVVACNDHKFNKYAANYVGSYIPTYILIKDSNHHYHFEPIDLHPPIMHQSTLYKVETNNTIVRKRRESIKYSGKTIKEALNNLALDYKYVAYSISSIKGEINE